MYKNRWCVLLVDDEVRMTRALADFFRSKKYHVFIAGDGQEALDIFYANNEKIDLIVLDSMMPRLDGISTLQALRDSRNDVPVVILTAKSEEEDQLEGFHCGADDYVTKPFSPSVLLARVDSILKRVGKTSEGVIRVAGITLNTVDYSVLIDADAVKVTKREFELLHYLLVNKNIALSREKILNAVWGYDYEGDTRTVDTHVKQLRLKLGDKAELIKTLHRVGYMLEVN